MTELTEDQVHELREAFKMFDKDQDGYITPRDVGWVLRGLGQTPTEADLKQIIKDVDTKGNGHLDVEQFIEMMVERQKSVDMSEELKEAFDVFDEDSDGYITTNELRHAMACLGERLTSEEVELMIKDADQDGDGKVNFEDFTNLMLAR